MHGKRVALLAVLLVSLVSCKQGEEEVGVESIEIGTQEYLDQASVCAIYFTYSGNQKMAQMALMNAAWEVSENENLNLLPLEELEEIASKEIERIKELFNESKVSQRDASYYLLSDNECLAHASMGGIWILLNQGDEDK